TRIGSSRIEFRPKRRRVYPACSAGLADPSFRQTEGEGRADGAADEGIELGIVERLPPARRRRGSRDARPRGRAPVRRHRDLRPPVVGTNHAARPETQEGDLHEHERGSHEVAPWATLLGFERAASTPGASMKTSICWPT